MLRDYGQADSILDSHTTIPVSRSDGYGTIYTELVMKVAEGF